MSASSCSFCRHVNPVGAKFCNDCGSPLHLQPCPECNAITDLTAAGCYLCGAALRPPPIAHPAADPSATSEIAVKAAEDASAGAVAAAGSTARLAERLQAVSASTDPPASLRSSSAKTEAGEHPPSPGAWASAASRAEHSPGVKWILGPRRRAAYAAAVACALIAALLVSGHFYGLTPGVGERLNALLTQSPTSRALSLAAEPPRPIGSAEKSVSAPPATPTVPGTDLGKPVAGTDSSAEPEPAKNAADSPAGSDANAATVEPATTAATESPTESASAEAPAPAQDTAINSQPMDPTPAEAQKTAATTAKRVHRNAIPRSHESPRPESMPRPPGRADVSAKYGCTQAIAALGLCAKTHEEAN